jgi:hypothetical protein
MKPIVLLLGSLTAVTWIGAADHAGGWNDGSRLATVECLVDHGTWAIDRSVFLTPRPYGPYADRLPHGTLDRLMIDGRYYSDKSPILALVLAAPYAVFRVAGGPAFADRPEIACKLLAFSSSGLSLVVVAACLFAFARRRGLSEPASAALAGSLAVSTLLLPYSRYVNNHETLAALTAATLLAIDAARWPLAGLLAGLAYATDLGAGPAILLATSAYACLVLARSGERTRLLCFALSAAVGVLGHHALNYRIGGTLGPANANPEFFHWPGCPFTAESLSGGWRHPTPWHFAGYALDLLFGKKGFYGHNPAFLLLLPALPPACRSPLGRLCLAWLAGVWLVYAAGSNNYSGECLSVRWFVPLVVPAAALVIELVAHHPAWAGPLAWLVACGVAVNVTGWWVGPWSAKVPGFWAFTAAAIVGAICLRPRFAPGEAALPSLKRAA